MKKIILWIAAVALVVGTSVAMFMRSINEEKEEIVQPITDPAFLYINIEQLVAKGAFDKFITPENRSLIATLLSSQLSSVEQAEHLKNIITDLNTIGVDIHTPIYIYLNENLIDYTAVVQVTDATNLDRTITLLSYLLEQSGSEAIYVISEGDVRMFKYENLAIAYNASSLAIVCCGDVVDFNVAKEAICRPKMDMSMFDASDIALLVNCEKYIELASAEINSAITELTKQYNAGEITMEQYSAQGEMLAERDEMFLSYAPYFEPGSEVLLSATFDLGRMTIAYRSYNVNFSEETRFGKATNMEHLGNLSKDAFAVMSAGIDGKIMAQFIRTVLSGEMLMSAGINPTNEVNMFISITCDALSTIDGGITLALENVEGEIRSRYNSYWEEYNIEPSINSVKAMLMADVNDAYIISNIAQFAGGFLIKLDDMHYTLPLFNYNFSMGQDNNLFYLGVNMTPQSKTPSALDAEWAKDIDGAMSYAVVNVDALMASQFMKATNKYITTNMLKEYRELYCNTTEAISYIYAAADSIESGELVVVFDNKSVNALEQINSLLLPVLVKECVKSLY